jgi:hypothetical protein
MNGIGDVPLKYPGFVREVKKKNINETVNKTVKNIGHTPL